MKEKIKSWWQSLSIIAYIEILLLIIFIVLLAIPGYGKEVWGWRSYWLITFLPEFSAVFATSIAIGLVYEFFVRRKSLEETLDLIKYSRSLNNAGICEYGSDFQKIDFQDFFRNSREIDIMFVYGRTWTEGKRPYLLEILKNNQVKMRLCLTDPDSNYLKCLQDNWHEPGTGKYSCEDLRRRIDDTLSIFRGLHEQAKNEKEEVADLSVYFSNRDMPYSFYRADNKMIVVIKKRGKEKTSKTPYFLVKKTENGEGLYDWVVTDFEKTLVDGGARVIYPA